MKTETLRNSLAISIVMLVLLIDQSVKIWIKTNMTLTEGFPMFGEGLDWAQIYFIENPGMAFGLELGGDYGKLFLTLFRIVAVGVIAVILRRVIKGDYSILLVISLSLIMAGAIGNIIDSIFYGVIFSESSRTAVAEFMPEAANNVGWFKGKVVDMLYFPMYSGHFPQWMPFIGGDAFTFFRPVFNIADSAITLGITLILLFQRSLFSNKEDAPETKPSDAPDVVAATEPDAITATDVEAEIEDSKNSIDDEHLSSDN